MDREAGKHLSSMPSVASFFFRLNCGLTLFLANLYELLASEGWGLVSPFSAESENEGVVVRAIVDKCGRGHGALELELL